jgi:hypothetical protein
MADFEKESFKFPHEAEETKGKPLEDTADDVEVIIEDDTPPEDRGREPLPTEVVKKLEVADEDNEELDPKAQIERIKQYKKVWNDERRAKEAAERERQAAFEALDRLNKENKQLKAQYNAGEKTYIETVQNAADTTLAMAKREYKEALESGESDRIVEAQAALSEATYKSQQAKQFKPSALQEEENDVQIPQSQQQPKVDPKTSAWLDENPWYGSKKAMSSFAVGIHEELVDEYGPKVVGTDQYFKHIDKTMRKKFPEYFDAMEESSQAEPDLEPQTAPKAKPSTVVAPATRSTSSKQVRLKQSQMAIIKKFGLTPEVYAREQQKLEASNG